MDPGMRIALDVAEGPLVRFALALALLGLLRILLLALADVVGGWLTSADRGEFWRKVRQRLVWQFAPTLVVDAARPFRSRRLYAYHLTLCGLSLLFRLGVVLVPTFMAAHVYLFERGFGWAWPALPGRVADTCAVLTITLGFVLFLGRLYSPLLRAVEPAWTFFKPLILLAPFLTGVLARHPLWSPLGYHTTLLLHVLSAAVVLALVPFARLLSCVHTRVTQVVPEAGWRPEPPPPPFEAAARYLTT